MVAGSTQDRSGGGIFLDHFSAATVSNNITCGNNAGKWAFVQR